jgi:hypothetical protein
MPNVQVGGGEQRFADVRDHDVFFCEDRVEVPEESF